MVQALDSASTTVCARAKKSPLRDPLNSAPVFDFFCGVAVQNEKQKSRASAQLPREILRTLALLLLVPEEG
jgi:hypothetical protein